MPINPGRLHRVLTCPGGRLLPCKPPLSKSARVSALCRRAFTLFSDTERENLHGHNFQVTLDAEAAIADDGLTFDYNILKKALKQMCDELDEQVIMPTRSPHLKIETDEHYTYVMFNGERIPFLDRDLTLLPIRNVTVEELAHYLLETLLKRERLRC